MDEYKIVFLVIGFIAETNEHVVLNEYDEEKEAEKYKDRYESRISIYDDFVVLKEKIPAKYNSYKDYIKHK